MSRRDTTEMVLFIVALIALVVFCQWLGFFG